MRSVAELSETCDFGANLEDSLRDRLVCGIRSDQSQKRLLTEKNLTFKKANKIALAMEMAIKDTKKLQGATGGAENVNEMRKRGITNSVFDAASQTMFPTTATSRTRSATTAVRLAIFIVSASKRKSGRRDVIKTKRVSKKKKNAKVKQGYSQWLKTAKRPKSYAN